MNKSKNIFLLIMLIIASLSSYSQTSTIEEDEGDKYLEVFAFDKAIAEYMKAYELDSANSVVTRKIADAYRRSGNLGSSAQWYQRTIDLDDSRKEDMLYLAEALKTEEKYDESLEWYQKYNELSPQDARAENHLENTSYYEELTEDSVMFVVKKLDFNNKKPAFGVTKYQEKLVFSATGLEGQKNNKTNPWNDLPYLDVYESNIDAHNEAVDIKPINEINSKYNDGPAFYDATTQTMLITRNNMKRGKPVKDKTGSVNLKIYTSTLVDGKWSEMTELPFNSNDYSTGHPAVSKDGSKLFFASNRPGGNGGTDIYVSERVNDTWGQPKNLGDAVNTRGNELFPYVSDDNVLYFSSAGLVGLGGLDLFKIPLDSIKTSKPINLGYPLNSSKDDFNLIFTQTDVSGYFCSNRDKGFSDDIFYFEINNVLQKIYAGRIESSIPDKSLAGNELIVRNLDTGEELSLILDENGEFEFPALPGVTYELAYQKEDVEEILTVVTVEDVVTQEYENLGIFTIEERLDVSIYDDMDEIEIDQLIYKRFGAEGKFVSEKGDTLTNIEMMDFLSRNLNGNDITLNDELYKYNESTKTYISELGDEMDDEELEKLLISQILSNPLDVVDESSIAKIDPKNSNLESVYDNDSGIGEINPSQMSALEWIKDALKDESLTQSEKMELEALQNSDLAAVSAEDWLKVYANNSQKSEELSSVARKALGLIKSIDLEPIADNASKNLVTNASSEMNVGKLNIENLGDYVLNSTSELETVLDSKNIENIYFDFDDASIRKDARAVLDEVAAILIANEGVEMFINAHTDTRGSNAYNDALSAKRSENVKKYLSLRGVKDNRLDINWFGEDQLAVNCPENSIDEEAHQLNRRAEFALTGTISGKNNPILSSSEGNEAEKAIASEESLTDLGLDLIYFNFDKDNIREDAQEVLNNLSAAMKANNKTVFIHAHTDARGNNSYNQALSKKRAASAKQFLISLGIDSSRIEIDWSGEAQLATKCRDGVQCSAQEHQLNRRASLTWK